MIKIRLHGTAEEVRHATREIKEWFDVLNVSDPYADRGESVYSRVYIDAETKADDGKSLDGFKNELEKEKTIIKDVNAYETYGNAFMLAARYFGHRPIDISALERVICNFTIKECIDEKNTYEKILADVLRELKKRG